MSAAAPAVSTPRPHPYLSAAAPAVRTPRPHPLPVGCRPGGVLEGAVLDIRDKKDGPLVEANGLVAGLAIKTHPKNPPKKPKKTHSKNPKKPPKKPQKTHLKNPKSPPKKPTQKTPKNTHWAGFTKKARVFFQPCLVEPSRLLQVHALQEQLPRLIDKRMTI
jgi:hypothetical protein